jgi:high-affinity K+ transport system ATPase subunit B
MIRSGSLSRLAVGVAFVLAFGYLHEAMAGGPAVNAKRALDLAQEQLDIRGLQASVFIESMSLRSATMLGGDRSWTVLWSESIPADGGLFEVGASVDMKGNVVRLLKKTASNPRSSP